MTTDVLRAGPPLDFERDLLAKLTDNWERRVAVKRDALDLDGHFETELPDFPAHLVPVFSLPEAGALQPEGKHRILSSAWISYNAKTAAIESEVILPACRLMLADHIPVRRDDVAVAALHQTIIDEHYHILMCHNAVGVTRRRRDLHGLSFDPHTWSVVRQLDACRKEKTGFSRDIIDIAFALAAETTINGFLSTISSAYDIQPMNRITVDMHRKDESGHAVVFRALVGSLYRQLDVGERELFKDALVQGLVAFRSPDFDPWVAVAETGEVHITSAQLAEAATGRPGIPRDSGPLRLLLNDLGIAGELGTLVAS